MGSNFYVVGGGVVVVVVVGVVVVFSHIVWFSPPHPGSHPLVEKVAIRLKPVMTPTTMTAPTIMLQICFNSIVEVIII